MTEREFITLARGVLDHPVVGAGQKYSTLEACLWLLFEAAWKPRRVRTTNGRTVGTMPIERGQLSYSRSYIATAWGWSEKRVRTFLHRLEREGMIDRRTGHLQSAGPQWFAFDKSRPLVCFAGIWTNWTSVRKVKEGETTNDLFGFLTTEPNTEVGTIHPKAMPVILTTPAEIET